jgi:hydrogenase expression/formation protein HypE
MNGVRKGYVRPLDLRHGPVDMTHGSGGRAMAQLIEELFAKRLGNAFLGQGNDAAVLPMPPGRLVMSTDAHVVSPLFFPGGDIGCLAVNGTINDVAVMGATPLYLAASFILEEGFPLGDLARIVESMARAASDAGVPVVTGDTKVVERGKGDGVYITTTGVGVVAEGEDFRRRPRPSRRPDHRFRQHRRARHGDHGAAREPRLCREHRFRHRRAAWPDRRHARQWRGHSRAARPDAWRRGDDAQRDRPPVGRRHDAAGKRAAGAGRGGRRLRVPRSRSALCRQRGQAAGDRRAEDCDKLLGAMRAHPLGQRAAVIGSVHQDAQHFVQMTTAFGGRRIVDWLTGEQLPRIC